MSTMMTHSIMCKPLALKHPLQRVAHGVVPRVPRKVVEFFTTAAQCFHLVCSNEVRINPYLDVMPRDL